MSIAQQKLDHPDSELNHLMTHLKELSASSESESRTDLTYDDGSILTLTSLEGAEVEAHVTGPKAPAKGN